MFIIIIIRRCIIDCFYSSISHRLLQLLFLPSQNSMLLIMGSATEADQRQVLQAPCLKLGQNDNNYKHAKHNQEDDQWMIAEGDHHHQDTYNNNNIPSSSSTSLEEDSSISNGSTTSSSDLVDDASSSSASSSNSSSNSNNGPLFELSELMAQLPIKRGLSKFYQGKSQSFTSLSRVMSIEDLAKKEIPYRKKMKSCKSYGGGLDIKATISKKVSSSRASFSSLSSPSAGRRSSFLGSSTRPPLVPVQKHF